MPETVTNTSPLQYLYQAGLLELLPALYGSIVVPQSVVEELSKGREAGVPLPDVSALDWVEVRGAREPALLPLVTDLGQGEREALAIALESHGSVLLDDALARKHAELFGLRFTGTLGVLLRAKREGHLEAVRPVLDRLDELGFRLGPAARAEVLSLAGE